MKSKSGFLLSALAALTLVSLGGAWWAVVADRQTEQKRYFEPRLLFPALAERLDDVGAIRIEIGKGLAGVQAITLVRTTQQKEDFFRIVERSSYLAREDMVRRLMSGMAGLEAIAPRSALPEDHVRLGLLAPDELGPSVRIILYDRGKSANGNMRRKKIAGVIVGKRPEGLGDVLGQSSIYVRRIGEQQSWLARGALPLRLVLNDWLDLDFFQRLLAKKINGQDFVLAKAQFVPYGSTPWRMTRAEAGQDFALTDRRGIPVRGIVDDRRVRQVALSLNDLVFEDVRPLTDLRFRRQHTAIYQSFSGLAIVFEIVGANGGYWARINARATARSAEARARALDRRLKGFAFLLPTITARRMILSAKALLKPSSRRKKKSKR